MLKITGDGRKAALDMRLVDRPARNRRVQARHRRRADRGDLARAPRPAPTTTPTPASAPRPPARCRSSSATSATPATAGTPTTSCAICSPSLGVPRRPDPLHPRSQQRRREGPAVRRRAAPGTSRCWSARPRRWASAPTSRRGRSRCTILTARGGRPIIEQREGRILRQGNQNPEVQILRYVVEGSFDAYSWQTVERKAKFINQVMRGRLDAREIEDIGDNALSFAEVKALASGDPLILDKAHADAEVTRLSRLERAWQRNHQTLRSTIAAASGRADTRERAIAEVTDALARRTDTRAERFAITINGTTLRERKPAGELLNRWAAAAQPGRTERLAQLGGLHILATVSPDYRNGGRELVLTLEGLAGRARARTTRSRTREPAHAHPPARAPRHHARRARGAPPRRTPSRDPRRTASPRSARPPVQVRRAARRRAPPARPDRPADRRPPPRAPGHRANSHRRRRRRHRRLDRDRSPRPSPAPYARPRARRPHRPRRAASGRRA